MENKRRKKTKQRHQLPENLQPKQRTRMIFDDIDVPQVVEPHPTCAICGEPIELISEAISEQGGLLSHFDCVIQKLKTLEHVEEPDSISYVGQGNFAVVSKSPDGNYFIKKRIPYESLDDFSKVKKQVEESKQ